ncbi:hypothetical protein MMC25_003292 [Agyrium rufum]|nr:hypothetical protein [Agyrium rufum]
MAQPVVTPVHATTSSAVSNIQQPYNWAGSGAQMTPLSASSNNTYLLPTSPTKNSRRPGERSKPEVRRTCGQRPACLVNASVTYCGNNQIYAFGGFDQYTDEVYNHVLKLDLITLQWTLVDNYGDIPGVRMGHTASLWQGDKLLVYGGENEHREYQSDIIIFDLKTAHWTQPDVRGPIPKGRARHAATIHDDKLFVSGGITGSGEIYTLDEICCLDLKTWTWTRSWSFVGRYDHSCWVWGGRFWVFGGLDNSMERTGELWWLDLKSTPAFNGTMDVTGTDSSPLSQRSSQLPRPTYNNYAQPQPLVTGSSGYTANSSSVQVRSTTGQRPIVPGSVSAMRFVSGPNVPSQASGTHFHVFSSGSLLDFTTPGGVIRTSECNLSQLELDHLRWQKLVEGSEIFEPGYRWQYCAVNEDGKKAWLLGCPVDVPDNGNGVFEEYLSDVLPIKLSRYGILGNDLTSDTDLATKSRTLGLDGSSSQNPSTLGSDLASMFDQMPESGSGADFIITGICDDDSGDEITSSAASQENLVLQDVFSSNQSKSRPIHVHQLILQARWPHFRRAYAAQMAEFHTRKMHIPEPYSVVRAFLYYLYTDSIAKSDEFCPSLAEVAGMLVMANLYDMPRLRLLCLHRLSREMDIDHAAVIWERASGAGEDWLRRRASTFCLTHWGRVVRTDGFRSLSRDSMLELCEVIDVEGRVVGGEELEVVGGLGGGKVGQGGSGRTIPRSRTVTSSTQVDDADDLDGEDDDGMEMT